MAFKKYKILSFLALFLTQSVLANDAITRLQPEEQNTIRIFDTVAPMVVNIHKMNHVMNPNLDLVSVETGSGSGFLWDSKHIVTNYHVVQGANEVVVTFKNGKTTHAKMVGSYPKKDIAVLALTSSKPLENLTIPAHFPLADSTQLHVGQNVIAIGNPFGLDHTLTRGIISALNRQIPNGRGDFLNNLIQTDASINPGNSGGPLLNSQGELIGMNTAIFSTSGSSAGIGFAILSNDIKRIVDQLIQYGKVTQSGLGILIYNDEIAHQFSGQGVLINRVLSSGPAYKAGLRGTGRDDQGNILLGDRITALNDKPIVNTRDLTQQMENIPVGETIQISFIRNGKTQKITLKTIALAD